MEYLDIKEFFNGNEDFCGNRLAKVVFGNHFIKTPYGDDKISQEFSGVIVVHSKHYKEFFRIESGKIVAKDRASEMPKDWEKYRPAAPTPEPAPKPTLSPSTNALSISVEAFKFWDGELYFDNETRNEVSVESKFTTAELRLENEINTLVSFLQKAAAEKFLKEEEMIKLDSLIRPRLAGVIHGYIQNDWLGDKYYIIEDEVELSLSKNINFVEIGSSKLILKNQQNYAYLVSLKQEVIERRARWDKQYEISYRFQD